MLELKKEKDTGALICNERPTMMWLESTSRCNLRCITCYRTYLPFFKGKDLDSEVFEIVKMEFFPYLKEAFIQVYGEPMIAANFEYIFEEAKKYNMDVMFVTNGMFLTERWLRKLLKYGIRFGISLDGARAETMQKIRRGADFKRIINSVKRFNELKVSEYKESKARIFMICVAMRSNIEELPELILLAKSLNISEVCIQLFTLSIHPLTLWKESLRYYKKLANKYLMLAKEKAEQLGVELKVSLYGFNEKGGARGPFSPRGSSYRFPQKCSVPWEGILVRTNGDVTPCCCSGEIMGNIKKDGFWDIWNGPQYREFRSRINTNLPPLDCINCIYEVGINAGNPENTKQSENLTHKILYFFERNRRLLKNIYCYLKDYL